MRWIGGFPAAKMPPGIGPAGFDSTCLPQSGEQFRIRDASLRHPRECKADSNMACSEARSVNVMQMHVCLVLPNARMLM